MRSVARSPMMGNAWFSSDAHHRVAVRSLRHCALALPTVAAGTATLYAILAPIFPQQSAWTKSTWTK